MDGNVGGVYLTLSAHARDEVKIVFLSVRQFVCLYALILESSPSVLLF